MRSLLTPKQLLMEFHVLEKMAQSTQQSETFCLDDYLQEEVIDAIHELDRLYSEYLFEHEEIFGGFGHNLVVTNMERKKKYDAIPKTRTYGELFQTLEREHGIVTSSKFHHNPNEGMTEQDFQDTLLVHKKLKGWDFNDSEQ